MQRQKIRPSYADLQDDFIQSDGTDSEDDVPQFAPAAIPIRGTPPPVIASSSSVNSSSIQKDKTFPVRLQSSVKTTHPRANSSKSSDAPKVVRIAPSSSIQVHEIEARSTQSRPTSHFAQSQRTINTEQQGPERFQFSFGEGKENDHKDGGEDEEIPPGPGPLIGTIQERIGLNDDERSKRASGKRISKFAQSKRAEKEMESLKINKWSSEDTSAWLDEDGEPMSAFRKERLVKQGKRPPSVADPAAALGKSIEEHTGNVVSPLHSTSVDPMQSMLQSISSENEAKVSKMSPEQVKESLQDLSETFGSDLLEKLRRRKDRTRIDVQDVPEVDTSSKSVKHDEEENTPDHIRLKYFPKEPNVLPPSLQWTTEPENKKELDQHLDESNFRFDFNGRLIQAGSLSYQDSRLAGLHHHGDDQERAGYTLAELLHLARSTLPSQSILALQTLERVFKRYSIKDHQREGEIASSQDLQISIYLATSHTRSKAAVIASWYIKDRQISVQSAALRCLDACLLSDILRALGILTKGQEKAALDLVNKILPLKEEIASDLFVLQPFINEMLRQESSLFHKDEDDIDPISGVDLWESATTGLPLRVDWPFIALDDLLHSGNCASLNRKNVLSSDWDANERQIVISSLRIGWQLWSKVIAQEPESVDVLPSPAEIRLAIIKVFMLEEAQGQDGRASGLITGRDLYRDEHISSLLINLMELTKAIERLPNRKLVHDDMEKAATRHFGASLPFYQLYTNLIGLYDSISFGMELFGRVLLLAQSNQYASDYRRLLWIDYGHSLPTIQTQLNQNPLCDLKEFLWTESKDDAIVQAMMNVLLQGKITRNRNELLFHIAVQQLGHVIWYSEEPSKRRLAGTIFDPNGANAEVQDAIKQYGLNTGTEGQNEKQIRQDWILGNVLANSNLDRKSNA